MLQLQRNQSLSNEIFKMSSGRAELENQPAFEIDENKKEISLF